MRLYFKFIIGMCLVGFLIPINGFANESLEKQVQYLSGTDNENTAEWDFFCTGGRQSGYWTKIEVPSCWEQQGFGSYNYGRDYHTYGPNFKYADEKGMYKHSFSVPQSWREKEIYLVFEGSMTDTEVKINGQLAGEIHQGSFYRFTYNITGKLLFDKPNLLEVTVSKMSSNPSVNYAERYADYWIFGGIFRPVYLEAYPKEYIKRMAVAAAADGSFSVDVFPENIKGQKEITAEIIDSARNIVKSVSEGVKTGDSKVTLKMKVAAPALWSSETPNLYKVSVSLKEDSKVLYKTTERFGFRTIEVKAGDGIYINGKKIKMKGINRHVFWPETGRTVNRKIDLMDIRLIKEMNMNAIRCSHYPPDQSFLEYCDSLGLYVLDELAGWQNAYDTEVGEKLVREMVIRDVNHPSVIFWSNGNEGGTNKELDDDFDLYDPSKRVVIHAHHKPGNAFNHIDTNHYESYESTKHILQDSLIYMTTEFLHCQNDGGGGAGLEDYWELMWTSPKSAGGFLWALLDEGVVRTDMGGVIDVNGVNAPDGVVGPHREKEGSFFAIREIFSPVHISLQKLPDSFKGRIAVENRFDFTNLKQCEFRWQLVQFNSPFDAETGVKILNQGTLKGSSIKPGEKGHIDLGLPDDWQKADALILKSFDPFMNEIYSWSWKIKKNEVFMEDLLSAKINNLVEVQENDSLLTLKTGDLSVSFSKRDGSISHIQKQRSPQLSFNNGPLLCSGQAEFESLKHFSTDDGHVVQVQYKGDMKSADWKLYNNGWLELNYSYSLKGVFGFAGISFDFPEEHMLSVKWLGNGPYRVWKNRMQGVTYNEWEKAYNNTVTGTFPWLYPEFKGYYSDMTWIVFNTVEGRFLVASKDDGLFVRLFEFYGLPGLRPHPELPDGDISFLDRIPAIGSKMSTKINARPASMGPAGLPNNVNDLFSRTVYFYFADFDMVK
jgi:Glycosyl hydrolases family 2, TIM barrel domain/Glycosyl hydrolases family 2, sugar binding domain/Glycosyl hydrolases family 2/Beta-galactosidase, domain 4